MRNDIQQIQPNEAVKDQIASHVERYQPRMLSAGQRTTMLEDIRTAVVRANPPTREVAGNWLSIVCRFVADTVPLAGGNLQDHLNSAEATGWVNACVRRGTSRHTMNTRRGVIERVVRAISEVPVTVNGISNRRVAALPLTDQQIVAVRLACELAGAPTLRAFAAAFCAGLVGAAMDGGTFIESGGDVEYHTRDGRQLAVVSSLVVLESLVGTGVVAGGWHDLRLVANSIGVYLNPQVAAQTFRSLVVREDDAFSKLRHRFRLSEDAINDIVPFLEVPNLDEAKSVVATLRQSNWPITPFIRKYSATHGTSRLLQRRVHQENRLSTVNLAHSSGDQNRGLALTAKKVSRAEVQRLAKAARDWAESYPDMPDSARNFIENYVPLDLDEGSWATVGPVLRDLVLRAGFQSDGAVPKHCTALRHYLPWRVSQGLSLNVDELTRAEAIDDFYSRGMSEIGDHTRNDYRSRLLNLARRISPDNCTMVPTAGYNAVRVGYSSAEEAAIRRIALAQRRPEMRRRLCAVVGFGAGCGVKPEELRLLRESDVRITDGGIHVHVPGVMARHVIVRRDYEELVREALKGLDSGVSIIKTGKDRANPAARIVEDAETYHDAIKIDMRRLRTTWITWLLYQPIPLSVIMAVSGLKSARTLVDMIDAIEPVEAPTSLRDGGVA
jgi:integrase